MRRECLIAVLVCFGAATAPAAEVRDPKTGLAVDPPAGFTAQVRPPSLGAAAEIEVERQTPPTSCSVSFEESTGNRGFAQEKLNELAKSKEFLDIVRARMGAGHDILSLDHMTQDGAVGIVLTLKSKMEFLANMRTYQAFFETPRGRTVVVCSTNQDNFDAFRKDYDAITKGLRLPR